MLYCLIKLESIMSNNGEPFWRAIRWETSSSSTHSWLPLQHELTGEEIIVLYSKFSNDHTDTKAITVSLSFWLELMRGFCLSSIGDLVCIYASSYQCPCPMRYQPTSLTQVFSKAWSKWMWTIDVSFLACVSVKRLLCLSIYCVIIINDGL